MNELFGNEDNKKSRNLLGIALGDMQAYSRLRSWVNQEFLATDALAKEMHEDYDIIATTTETVMAAIGEVAASSVLSIGDAKTPILGLPETDAPAAQPTAQPIGDVETIAFGSHIWRVLKTEKKRRLVVTQDIVAHMGWGEMRFNDIQTSDIYRYLNGVFLDSFEAGERKKILSASRSLVFLLNREEAVTCFHGDTDRIAQQEDTNVEWWLVPNQHREPFHYVSKAGEPTIVSNNNDIHKPRGIRPALWIKK